MKIMKNIYFTSILIGSILLSSCDSFLDIQPVGKVIPNTLSEYRALLTTAYSTKLIDRGVTELRTDIATVVELSTSQNFYGDIEKWNDLSPNASTREFSWSTYYNIIYYANAIIENKDNITEGSKENIDQLIGEAYMLRAYSHFILVNLYGQPYTKEGATESKAIPLKWNLNLEEIPSRSTVKEIYAAILSDIQSARGLINQKVWESQYSYRFSTLSVDAMESRVCLYMGEWDKAYNAAERVLSKKSALENLNEADAKLPNDYKSVEMITAYEAIYNDDLSGASLLTAAFMKKYETEIDLRTNRYYGIVDENGNYPTLKCGEAQYNCTFRTGEIYLNAAEAATNLNKLPEARIRLLKLMENRYTPEGYEYKKNIVNKMNQEMLLTEIIEERARELAFEGHRWFDLRRTTRPRIEKLIDGKSSVLSEDDARYTLRIPQSAINANPGLLD